MWWHNAKHLSSESGWGKSFANTPRPDGRTPLPAASQASCEVIEPFKPNLVQSALRTCARGGMHRFVCKCHIATLSGTRALSWSSFARLGMVYIAPISSYPDEVFRYNSDVGRPGSNVKASRNPLPQ